MRIDDVFCNIYGKLTWGAKRTHGSSLIIELGEPRLQIREPVKVVHTTSERAAKSLARRRVMPCGEWSLVIEDCNWDIAIRGGKIASSESPQDVIEEGVESLDGQSLSSVKVDPKAGSSVFLFDLGGELRTWPSLPRDDQWTLYAKDGRVFVYRGDGTCFSGSSRTAPSESDWVILSAN